VRRRRRRLVVTGARDHAGHGGPGPGLSPLGAVNLALRGLMEAGVVAGLAYWGWQTGGGTFASIALAIAAPVVGFGFWGAVDFRRAGALAEPLRLVQELAVSGLAALALYTAGQHALGAALALLSIVHHALVYALGDRLVKRDPAPVERRSETAGRR
jgi:Protein of unknown function (DUF2568)